MTTVFTVSINGDVNYPLAAITQAIAAPSEFADVALSVVPPGSRADIYVVDLQQLKDAFGLPGEYGGLAVDLPEAGVGYAGLDASRIGVLDPLAVATHEIVGHLVAKLQDDPAADRAQTIMTYDRPLPRLQADDITALQARYGVSPADDTMRHGGGSGAMSGGLGDDMLYGNQGSDALYGNHGSDTLFGGGGNDQLFGGQGDDVLVGGVGADTFIGGAGHNTIVGYSPLEGDVLLGFDPSHDTIAGYDWLLA
jgi:Ca2+-binding RTX toxin-like protein